MNKKAGEKLLSAWWFFILATIGLGITLGVSIYYSFDFNTNLLESEILNERLVDCLVDSGYIRSDFFQDNFDIFGKCDLKKEIFVGTNKFYFKIRVYNESGIKKEIFFGDSSFEENCRISYVVKTKDFPKCSEKILNVLHKNENLKLYVMSGVRQNGKKYSVL